MHYQRSKAPIRQPKPTIYQRLFARLDTSGDCWVWTGGTVKGYGMISQKLTHRVAWELEHGAIPAGKNVLHRCDNPPCCRTEHLFLGTNADNVQDKVAKGRQYRGERHNRTHLTETDVRDIRAAHAAGERSRAIAARYGMKRHSINGIVARLTWKHVV